MRASFQACGPGACSLLARMSQRGPQLRGSVPGSKVVGLPAPSSDLGCFLSAVLPVVLGGALPCSWGSSVPSPSQTRRVSLPPPPPPDLPARAWCCHGPPPAPERVLHPPPPQPPAGQVGFWWDSPPAACPPHSDRRAAQRVECRCWQTARDAPSSSAAPPCPVPNRLPDVTQAQGSAAPSQCPGAMAHLLIKLHVLSCPPHTPNLKLR